MRCKELSTGVDDDVVAEYERFIYILAVDILLLTTRILLVIHILAVEEMRKSRLKSTSVMLKQGNQCDRGMSYDSGRRPL